MNHRIPLTIGAILTLCSCSSLSKITVGNKAPDIQCPLDIHREIRQIVQPMLDGGKISGINIGVRLPDGRKEFIGRGRISETDPAPPGPDTVAAIGSVTKGLVGALALHLSEEGSIDLDSMLVLPDVPGNEFASHITLRELATHTSGLPRQPNDFHFFRLFLGYLFTGKDFYRGLDTDQAYEYLRKWKGPNAAGKENYSNIGYALLADQLQKDTGKPLESLLAVNILDPIGMAHTGFDPDKIPGNRMSGHAGDQPKFIPRGTPVEDWIMNPFMRGTGGMYSTPRDLLAYAEYSLSPAASQAAMYQVAWHPDPLGNPNVHYQYGVNSGHTTFVGIDTENRIAVVVMQDTFNWQEAVGRDLLLRIASGQKQCGLANGSIAADSVSRMHPGE